MRHFDMAQRKQERGFILNIVAIIVVLGIIYFSQQANFRSVGVQAQQQSQNYLDKGIEWVKTNIYPRVSSEVEKRGGQLTQQANTAKNNFAQTIWEGIVKYLQKNFNYLFKTDVQ